MADTETHMCLLRDQHGPHDWWYTSSGGGHMLREEFKDDPRERDVKKWHCPGLVVITGRTQKRYADFINLTTEQKIDYMLKVSAMCIDGVPVSFARQFEILMEEMLNEDV